MANLNKEDLSQMNRCYFQSLSKERLVEVADNLHLLAVEQWEKINSNSDNSSQPPSSNNPFKKQQQAQKSPQKKEKPFPLQEEKISEKLKAISSIKRERLTVREIKGVSNLSKQNYLLDII